MFVKSRYANFVIVDKREIEVENCARALGIPKMSCLTFYALYIPLINTLHLFPVVTGVLNC